MTTTTPTRPPALTTPRRPLAGWIAADIVSVTGTRVSMIALPLFVLMSTGSATQTGLVALAEMIPLVALKALSGPVIDQVGARTVAVACDLGSTLVVGSIPLLHHAHRLPFGALLALVAVAGALRGPGDAAKNALAPQVAATAGLPMERVTGLAATAERTASMAGAALAGVLVAAVGPVNALFVDAASFVVSALVLLWSTIGLHAAISTVEHDTDHLRYVGQLKAGWDFLRRDRLLLGIALMVALTNLLDQAWVTVLMPVWAIDSGRGAAVLGLLFALFSGASALGALCAAIWGPRLPRYAIYLGAFLLTGLPRFLILAFDSPFWAVLSLFAVGGFAAGFINPILSAIQFERIPPHLVGRVSSLVTSMAWGLMPLGSLLGGLLVDGWGLTTALVVCGVGYFVVTMTPALNRSWREMDRRPPSTSLTAPA